MHTMCSTGKSGPLPRARAGRTIAQVGRIELPRAVLETAALPLSYTHIPRLRLVNRPDDCQGHFRNLQAAATFSWWATY